MRAEENVTDLGNFGNEKSCKTKGKKLFINTLH